MLGSCLLVATLAAAGAADASRCAAIPDDARRLACYDALFRDADRPAPPVMAGEPAAPAKPTVAAAAAPAAAAAAADPDRDFGLSGHQRAERSGPGGEPDEIQAVVVELLESRVGKPTYVLDNGHRWRQTDATSRPKFKVGQTVVIRKASLGSFLASSPDSGGAPVRIRRVD